jgi:hypothetical protein
VQALVLSLCYIDRISTRNPTFSLTVYNVHRFVITSIIIAHKFLEDTFYEDTYYARLAGVQPPELKQMLLAFLDMIGFELFVDAKTYAEYARSFAGRCCAHRESSSRFPALISFLLLQRSISTTTSASVRGSAGSTASRRRTCDEIAAAAERACILRQKVAKRK